MRNVFRDVRRPLGRLFLCLISLLAAVRLEASGPTLTTVNDIVYRADGSAASGTIVITWPNFSTADSKAVAAGELHVTIGSGGVMSIALAPNANSLPAGTYYKVVYKLDDGTTSTEYWVVPATGPTTIAAIRATVVPTQVAAQLASKQYVDSAVGNVVHVTGAETISGVKIFSVSPTAPDPSSASAVATKNYVDVLFGGGGGGSGSFLATSGGTMTGTLFLAGDPTSPTQATTRHYVDIQTTTLTAGIASKLGRINDSPITLAGVRYADQFTGASVGAQIDAACADLSGANGMVVVPSTLGAGWSLTGIPSNCTVYDFRGVGGSTQTAYSHGAGFYGRYTQVGSGLQIVSPMLIEFDAYAGGVNSWPGGAATKTQWQGLRIQGRGRTIGERKGIEINLATTGKGDSIGIMASSFDSGGYNTGGDEGSEGGRFMSMQGDSSADGGFPRGSVASVSGNIVTGTWTSGTNANLGEQRPLINISRGVYNTGTVASISVTGSPVVCTINGSGTSWSTLGTGAKTDLFLEIAGNSSGTTKHVVPVTSITDDTHLVVEYSLAEIGATCYSPSMVISGAYNIYKGGMVASLASPLSGSLDATAVNLNSGGGNFLAGDTIQQPLGYNYHGSGVYSVISRVVGEQQGSGFYTHNVGTPAFRDAFRASGSFVNGISFDSGNLSGFGVLFTAPVSGGLLRSNDVAASSQVVYNLLNGSGTQRTLTYDRTNDWWQWGPNTNIYFSGTDQRMSLGTSPAANTLGYFYYNNSAWDGLIVAPNATPGAGKAIFDTQVAGVPRLRVENSRTIVNNGSDLVGFSDDRSTQKWKITGADGTILGSTINATTGFQVGGAALSFSNIAGTLGASAGGTGTTSATGTAGSVVLSNSPTIVTPTIASFANAAHDHSNAAGGGNISTTAVASGNKTGIGTKFATGTGTYTSGDCVKIDANGNLVDNGSACGGGGGGGSSAGTTNDIQVAGAGSTFVADSGNLTYKPSTHQMLINGGGSAFVTGLSVQVGSGAVVYPGALSSSTTATLDSQYRFFAQEDTWTPPVDGHGAAGFEAGVVTTGSHSIDHYAGFENNPHFTNTGGVSYSYGLHDGPTVANGVTLNTRRGVHIDPITLSGTGAVNTNEAIYVSADTAGSSNWTFVSDKTAPSYFAGKVAVGAANNPVADMDVNNDVLAAVYKTRTNCAAAGTSASPSVVSCGSAAAGHFSCATNATGATCTVNTTAVGTNSEIFIQESDTSATGTLLGVTCNTSTNVLPASHLLASQTNGTGFTINLGTVTTNPACFSYHVVNQ